MIFSPTPLAGSYVVELELLEDFRGFFARAWCSSEFGARGLDAGIAQCSISFNKVRGTLRGMHYQIEPHEEVKLVRCTTGSIYDVVIDLREKSPTYRQHFAVTLSAS